MPKASNEPLHKHTLFLFEGDYQRLQEIYPDVSAAEVIRQIIRNHIKRVIPETDVTSINVEGEI